jgi:hypothetical protein
MPGMNELPASPKKPSATSQEMMLTSEQHAKLAAFYQAGPEFEPGTGAVEAEAGALPHEFIEDGVEARGSQSPARCFRSPGPMPGHQPLIYRATWETGRFRPETRTYDGLAIIPAAA